MLKNFTDFMVGAISIYMLLIIGRIIMSWLGSQNYNEKGLLPRLCDPYLNIFRRIRAFTIGYIDFSPIVALAVLVIAGDILNKFGDLGTISFGAILAIVIIALWNAISTLFVFLFFITIIRFVIYLVRPNAISPVLTSLDSLLGPVSAKIASFFVKNGSYTTNLILLCVAIMIFYFAGAFVINFLAELATALPF
ncbi:MAG: YggT family protein [Spirochaetes bacterium]|nr:YggT family protein [Spirochaetota bacterium]